MTEAVRHYLLLCGALAPLWMLAGVTVGGWLYPGYSHTQQAMSELGARNRPTAKIHPFINNFPIGLLFSVFGFALLRDRAVPLIAGLLLIVHGLSHIVAGLFPCDEDMGAKRASTAHKVHAMAGVIMYFSLLAACVLWIFIESTPRWFGVYSLLSALGSVVSLSYMVSSLKTGRNLGLHQRISYGVLALWSAVLSVLLYEI
jgi:hypothetical membrane protein